MSKNQHSYYQKSDLTENDELFVQQDSDCLSLSFVICIHIISMLDWLLEFTYKHG